MQSPDDIAVRTLTPREVECLRLVGRHMQTKEIARELDLAPNTVNTYIKSACDRLGVQTRREAANRLLAFEARSQETGEESTEPAPIAKALPAPAHDPQRHLLLRPILALQHPGPKTDIFIKVVAFAAFALAIFMALEAVIVALHNAMHPDLQPRGGHRLGDALPHGRQSLANVLLTGKPSVRLFLAVSFFGPAVGMLKGGAALRIASLTMFVLVFANICVRFSPMTTTITDALQLAVYVGLLGLTRQFWARVLITMQSAILVADIAFHIQGIIDRRTWEAVQLLGVNAMVLVVLWAVFDQSRRRAKTSPAAV